MAGDPQQGVQTGPAPLMAAASASRLMGLAGAWNVWLPIAAGLIALYLPSYFALAGTTWDTPENGHGPIMLAVVAGLLWQKRKALLDAPVAPDGLTGWASLITGLLCFVLGRSQGIATFEVASHVPVLAGVVLLKRGWSGLRAVWFPMLFLLFAIPLPGALVEAITGLLKQEVSVVVEQLLYMAGYPVARNGVVLIVGQYQLLVADACSGLNSLFSLSALAMPWPL